ncbi:LytR C-terminal domain-containing protein [Pseudonocardia oceani]|uniref:LytR C-terminal domain-containing protein n=4 Tax=Pseudonocardia oceani TaxID=2792013 RepID=A0ABS6U8M4_9PSEU|nr:LytR C-terminal domain-containing protein [Pseudonocardia oceani]MBW0122858.1 LytR C-terminal domain-containing protein [Pseudonocardia oceani]MBW0128276.1 LytR C-terminal domain-containing protein [Pseudonocardia oceani]
MTAPAPSGGPSPLRIGGLALLGVGAVAGIIGLATLATGGGDGSSSAAPSTSVTASPGDGFTETDGVTPPGGVAPTDGAAPGQPGATPGQPGDGSGDGTGDGAGGVPIPSFGPTPTGGIAAPGDGSGGTGTGGTGNGSGSGNGSGGGSGGAAAAGSGSGGGSGGAESVRMPLRVYNNSTIPGLAARAAADFEAAGWTVADTGGYNGLIPTSTVYYRAGTAERDAAEFLGSAFGLRVEERFEGIQSSSPGVIVILTKDYQGA